ncbi:MAG: DUF58 domain-containing protein, partial [Acidimicrobiia bacterium]|nr:DUF58 domain-containing protein [Acidimicrobiia bacterium]
YVPGDDFRKIDHQLWARLGQVLVRRFEAEEDLTLTVLIDATASMGMYGKFDVARRIAAIVSYLALSSGDRVVPVLLGGSDRQVTRGPIGRHRSAWPHIERWLEGLSPAGAAPLAPAIRGVVGPVAGSGAVVVISDLLDAEWERALDGAGLGVGGVVAHVLAPEELDPGLVGDLRLVDVETGAAVEASTSSSVLDAYAAAVASFIAGVAGRSRRGGLDHVLVRVDDEAGERFLRRLVEAAAVT